MAKSTPFASEPLLSQCGYDGLSSFAEQVLQGTADLSHLPIPVQGVMENMKAMAPPMPFTEPTDSEIKAGFSKWPEQTSTSPSGRHLGHYKALFAPIHRASSPPDPEATPTQKKKKNV